jgi:hypothetical protein
VTFRKRIVPSLGSPANQKAIQRKRAPVHSQQDWLRINRSTSAVGWLMRRPVDDATHGTDSCHWL